MTRQAFTSAAAPQPGGNYSSAVGIGKLVQIAGQGPLDPVTGEIVAADFAAQARRTFANVLELLGAAGLGTNDVLMLRVYLTNPADFKQMDQIMGEYFARPFPARTTVFVGLGAGMHVEIDALAAHESLPAQS